MQALPEKTMRFQQKHLVFTTAMNKNSCSIPIARSMQKKALSSPELGAFLHIWGQNVWRSSLVYKKIVDIVHTTYYIKGKGA